MLYITFNIFECWEMDKSEQKCTHLFKNKNTALILFNINTSYFIVKFRYVDLDLIMKHY